MTSPAERRVSVSVGALQTTCWRETSAKMLPKLHLLSPRVHNDLKCERVKVELRDQDRGRDVSLEEPKLHTRSRTENNSLFEIPPARTHLGH